MTKLLDNIGDIEEQRFIVLSLKDTETIISKNQSEHYLHVDCVKNYSRSDFLSKLVSLPKKYQYVRVYHFKIANYERIKYKRWNIHHCR